MSRKAWQNRYFIEGDKIRQQTEIYHELIYDQSHFSTDSSLEVQVLDQPSASGSGGEESETDYDRRLGEGESLESLRDKVTDQLFHRRGEELKTMERQERARRVS